MSTSRTSETRTSGLTRREVILGGAATAAVAFATAAAPQVADASTGDAVTIGGSFYDGNLNGTTFTNTTDGTAGGTARTEATIASDGRAIAGITQPSAGYAVGVYAQGSGSAHHGLAAYNYGGGTAVFAQTVDPGGTCLHAQSYAANTTAVHAEAASGTALRVDGPAVFSRSGVGTVARTKSSVKVTVPGGISSSALVLVTMRSTPTGVYLRYARRANSTQFVVQLNKGTAAAAPFAWFVVG